MILSFADVCLLLFIFFFQAEDGIRDLYVTGVQTCALPICSWGPVSVSTSASYNVSNSASVSQQTARTQSNELTRKASSRSKKEHKTSFKVASASGTEDQAVRLIKNPFPDRTTRVDYYDLVRKWREIGRAHV